MKVTAKNTAYIISVAIIFTLLLTFVNILGLLINHPLTGMKSYEINLLTECAYLVCIFYIRDILKYLNETKSITTAFYIYICLNLLAALAFLFTRQVTSAIYIRAGFNFAALVAKIYLIVQLFRIKNPTFGKYFSALAGSMLIAMFFELVEDLLKIQHWKRNFINPLAFLSQVPPALIITFTLYKIFLHLKNEPQAFKQTSLSANEPA